MGIQAIYLDREDDIVSIRDRLNWAREPQVLLVLPDEGDLLTEYLDLAFLRRHADALRLEVGLVTVDGRVIGQAKALGFATFPSVNASVHNKRRWWRGRRRHERVGYPTLLSEGDRREVERRKAPRPNWQRWLLRYMAILLYLLTIGVLFVTAVYAVPGATITLKPEVQPLRVTKQIVADPQLEAVSVSGSSVPGRILVAVQEWQAEVETTGTTEVADAPARGEVVFVNQLEQPATVPAGTRVSTSAGSRVVFQTLSTIEVPGGIGATARAEAVAVEPGPSGNVEANLVNRVEGSLALQLNVRNLEPMEGGGVRIERSVTEADHQRLRSQVMQQLQVMALGDMDQMLTGQEFIARDSLRVVRILHETYSHFPGEQTDQVAVDIRAELQATAVDENQAVGLVYEELAETVGSGFELVPESLAFGSGDVLGVDNQGRVTFEMIGEGRIAAHLALSELIESITGQEIALAMAYLNEKLPVREQPTARVWPNWFGRMPYLPMRIRTQIETS